MDDGIAVLARVECPVLRIHLNVSQIIAAIEQALSYFCYILRDSNGLQTAALPEGSSANLIERFGQINCFQFDVADIINSVSGFG